MVNKNINLINLLQISFITIGSITFVLAMITSFMGMWKEFPPSVMLCFFALCFSMCIAIYSLLAIRPFLIFESISIAVIAILGFMILNAIEGSHYSYWLTPFIVMFSLMLTLGFYFYFKPEDKRKLTKNAKTEHVNFSYHELNWNHYLKK